MNDCLSNWRCSFWEHQQRCGGAGGGALLSRVFAQIKGSEKEMNHSEVIANDRYSSTLGECGDCCVFEMQKWQFNYLCLTWRWKGSESLWEHVYIYSGFFFLLNDPMNHANARCFGKHSTFWICAPLTWIHSWNQTWLYFVFITPFALLSLNDVAFTKVHLRFNGLNTNWVDDVWEGDCSVLWCDMPHSQKWYNSCHLGSTVLICTI